MLDSKSESIELDIINLPPVIASLTLPNMVNVGNVTLNGDGMDPMGDTTNWIGILQPMEF